MYQHTEADQFMFDINREICRHNYVNKRLINHLADFICKASGLLQVGKVTISVTPQFRHEGQIIVSISLTKEVCKMVRDEINTRYPGTYKD